MRKRMWLIVATLVVGTLGAGVAELSPVEAQAPPGNRVEIVEDQDPQGRYEPPDLTVPAGSTVVWHNAGQYPHTATANDKSFDSSYISPGAEWQWAFSAPGEFPYYCTLHPSKKGIIRVTP